MAKKKQGITPIRKGEIRNPMGMSREQADFRSIYSKIFYEVFQPDRMRELLQVCYDKALEGNRYFMDMILPYALGQPTQFIDINQKQTTVHIEILQKEMGIDRKQNAPVIVDVEQEPVAVDGDWEESNDE